MKLTGYQAFGPIRPFDAIETPPFIVIIGPNGVGKTQLLRAIAQGSVSVGERAQGQSGPTPGAVLITNSDELPAFGDVQAPHLTHSAHHFSTGNASYFKYIATKDVTSALAADLGISEADLGGPNEDFWKLGPEGVADKIGASLGSENFERIAVAFEQADCVLSEQFRTMGRFHHDPTREIIISISRRLGIRPTLVTQEMVSENFTIGSFGSFSPQIDKVVSFYRDRFSRNLLAPLNGLRQLDPEAFEAVYGPPPWQMIDEILNEFGLPYTVMRPTFDSPPPPYRLMLQRTGVDGVIDPQSISSGEKILLRFALAMMRHDPLRVMLEQPKLLLLDELDASLHPQMVNRWMETLQEEFVAKRRIDCILTTHSPITVALAPEDAIYELTGDNPAPVRIDKQQALNRLTIGLPTLSIDYSGQRQVFVESDTDAAIFNAINAKLKKSIGLQRTLSFISTGYRDKRGIEQNAGCSVVTSVATSLRNSGNRAVFGLVDWDLTRTSSHVIKVLAEGTHYTLENLLLDPLLVGVLLLRDSDLVVPDEITIASLSNMNSQICQAIADHIQHRIVFPAGRSAEAQEIKYNGAPSIMISKSFNVTPGHEIEPLLVDAFPYLNRYARNRGAMVKAIVDRVLPLHPELCPLPIVHAFRAIADQEC